MAHWEYGAFLRMRLRCRRSRRLLRIGELPAVSTGFDASIACKACSQNCSLDVRNSEDVRLYQQSDVQPAQAVWRKRLAHLDALWESPEALAVYARVVAWLGPALSDLLAQRDAINREPAPTVPFVRLRRTTDAARVTS
jgi:hypothetical protein